MATRLLYLEDFDVVGCTATVTAVGTTEDGRVDVQLDQTCFYPRGGGQDWDTGTLSGADGASTLVVDEVRLDEAGIVHQYGRYTVGQLRVGDVVECAVDEARRTTNTRLHSAGHVIDMALDQLGQDWPPMKAGHYPHMCFVQYAVDLTPEVAERMKQEIERVANELIDAGSHNEIRFMPISEMHTVCHHVPANIPTNKPARVVLYRADFGIPCGGTHVRDIHDIGHITITKLKSKKGETSVSYAVEGIN